MKVSKTQWFFCPFQYIEKYTSLRFFFPKKSYMAFTSAVMINVRMSNQRSAAE